MHGPRDSRHPLVGLIDETSRLHGRVKGIFAQARQTVGLGESEIMVLNAVVEAKQPPTVSQIARSLGVARQLVQRAANSMVDAGLIAMADNPDHKRAALLLPTEEGRELKRKADRFAEEIAEQLAPALELEDVKNTTEALRKIRRDLEARLRARQD